MDTETYSQTLWGMDYKLRSLLGSFCDVEEGYRFQELEGIKDTNRTWPTESTKQDSNWLTETEEASTWP